MAIAGSDDPRSAELAARLAVDSNTEVALQTIESTANWPVAQAGPVLLAAMSGTAFAPRKLAAERLAASWRAAADFEVDAPQQRRNEQVGELQRRWHAEFASTDTGRLRLPVAHDTGNNSPDTAKANQRTATTAQVREAERLLLVLASTSADDSQREVAIEQLKAVGPALPVALERIVAAHRQAIPEVVYHDVLPAVSVEFDLIERLQGADAAERRRAAEELQREFAANRLSTLAYRDWPSKWTATPIRLFGSAFSICWPPTRTSRPCGWRVPG